MRGLSKPEGKVRGLSRPEQLSDRAEQTGGRKDREGRIPWRVHLK